MLADLSLHAMAMMPGKDGSNMVRRHVVWQDSLHGQRSSHPLLLGLVSQSRVEMLRSQKEFYERRCHELAAGRGESARAQEGAVAAIGNGSDFNTAVSEHSGLSCCVKKPLPTL